MSTQRKNTNQSHWRVVEHAERARKVGLSHSLTDEQWFATVNYFKRKCAYCLRKEFEVLEHFIPITQGGGTTSANCVPACTSCNTCKDHPKFLLLGDREKAHAALCRVAAYLKIVGGDEFNQFAVDAYIQAQYQKVPTHHNKKGRPVLLNATIANSPFNAIRQMESNREFWSARDLQGLLGYTEWRKFEDAIERAIIACKNSGHNSDDHFVLAAKMVSIGSGAEREVYDYQFSRYACYLVAMNSDPRKKEVSAAQTYFAVKTHQAETQSPTSPLAGEWPDDIADNPRRLALAIKGERAKLTYLQTLKALRYPELATRGRPSIRLLSGPPTPEHIQAEIIRHLTRLGELTLNTLYNSYMKRHNREEVERNLTLLVEQGQVYKMTTAHSVKYFVPDKSITA